MLTYSHTHAYTCTEASRKVRGEASPGPDCAGTLTPASRTASKSFLSFKPLGLWRSELPEPPSRKKPKLGPRSPLCHHHQLQTPHPILQPALCSQHSIWCDPLTRLLKHSLRVEPSSQRGLRPAPALPLISSHLAAAPRPQAFPQSSVSASSWLKNHILRRPTPRPDLKCSPALPLPCLPSPEAAAPPAALTLSRATLLVFITHSSPHPLH